jgi:hypothetical protein
MGWAGGWRGEEAREERMEEKEGNKEAGGRGKEGGEGLPREGGGEGVWMDGWTQRCPCMSQRVKRLGGAKLE